MNNKNSCNDNMNIQNNQQNNTVIDLTEIVNNSEKNISNLNLIVESIKNFITNVQNTMIIHEAILLYEIQLVKDILRSDYTYHHAYENLINGKLELTDDQKTRFAILTDQMNAEFKFGLNDLDFLLQHLKQGENFIVNQNVLKPITIHELQTLLNNFAETTNDENLKSDLKFVIDLVIKKLFNELGEYPFANNFSSYTSNRKKLIK